MVKVWPVCYVIFQPCEGCLSLVTKFNLESSVLTRQPFLVFSLEFDTNTDHSQHIQDAVCRELKGQTDIVGSRPLLPFSILGLEFLFCLAKK